MPVDVWTCLEVILFDFQRLGIALYGVIIIGFAIAFTITGLITKYSTLNGLNDKNRKSAARTLSGTGAGRRRRRE